MATGSVFIPYNTLTLTVSVAAPGGTGATVSDAGSGTFSYSNGADGGTSTVLGLTVNGGQGGQGASGGNGGTASGGTTNTTGSNGGVTAGGTGNPGGDGGSGNSASSSYSYVSGSHCNSNCNTCSCGANQTSCNFVAYIGAGCYVYSACCNDYSTATNYASSGGGGEGGYSTRTYSKAELLSLGWLGTTQSYTYSTSGMNNGSVTITTTSNNFYVKQSSTWKTVNTLYVKDGGIWKPVKAGYIKSAGTWKNFW